MDINLVLLAASVIFLLTIVFAYRKLKPFLALIPRKKSPKDAREEQYRELLKLKDEQIAELKSRVNSFKGRLNRMESPSVPEGLDLSNLDVGGIGQIIDNLPEDWRRLISTIATPDQIKGALSDPDQLSAIMNVVKTLKGKKTEAANTVSPEVDYL